LKPGTDEGWTALETLMALAAALIASAAMAGAALAASRASGALQERVVANMEGANAETDALVGLYGR
jgi:type IV secretory pathway VirB2 component (pilin)